MKEHLTELVWVIDAGEEAAPFAQDVARAYNAAVEAIRGIEGERVQMTTVVAGETPKVLYAGKDASKLASMTKRAYAPHGESTLPGALRGAIDATGERLYREVEEERPSKVAVAVISLGKKDAGDDAEELALSIAHQRDIYNWTFLYLGFGVAAVKQAAAIGIGGDCAVGFSADADGIASGFEAVARAMRGLVSDHLPEDWRKGVVKRARKPAAKKSVAKKSGAQKAAAKKAPAKAKQEKPAPQADKADQSEA